MNKNAVTIQVALQLTRMLIMRAVAVVVHELDEALPRLQEEAQLFEFSRFFQNTRLLVVENGDYVLGASDAALLERATEAAIWRRRKRRKRRRLMT